MEPPEEKDVEVDEVTQAEIESAHPLVAARELRLNHVYVLHSERHRTVYFTLNYGGSRHLPHPVTLDTVRAHLFHGERVSAGLILIANPDGSFSDFKGTRITVRRYIGTDV